MARQGHIMSTKQRASWVILALALLTNAPAGQAAPSAGSRQAQLKDMGAVLAESLKSDDALKACFDAAQRGEDKSFYALAIVTDAYRLLDQRTRLSEQIIASHLDSPAERRQAENYALATLPKIQEAIRGYRNAMDYCSGKINGRAPLK
jgi:hypothetical protein